MQERPNQNRLDPGCQRALRDYNELVAVVAYLNSRYFRDAVYGLREIVGKEVRESRERLRDNNNDNQHDRAWEVPTDSRGVWWAILSQDEERDNEAEKSYAWRLFVEEFIEEVKFIKRG
jgi:hypothetical protein